MPVGKSTDYGAARNHVRLFIQRILTSLPNRHINNSAYRRRYENHVSSPVGKHCPFDQ